MLKIKEEEKEEQKMKLRQFPGRNSLTKAIKYGIRSDKWILLLVAKFCNSTSLKKEGE